MKISQVAITSLIAFSLLTTLVFSQGVWEVNTISPTPIGPQVAKWVHTPASPINPDVVWPVPADGILQFIAKDHDPKCKEPIGYVQVEGTPYPIPTSPPKPGQDCTHTVNDLFHSRVFTVSQGSEVWGEQGSSGSFVMNFVTFTPTPTATATTTPTATPIPTEVATAIPTMTHTPTPTPAVEEPEVVASCVSVFAEALEDGSYLIWVEAIGATEYIFYDGIGYQYFVSQPFQVRLTPGVAYKIYVGDDGSVECNFQIEPTASFPIQQPGEFQVSIPFITN
jgi:hypothetical protein